MWKNLSFVAMLDVENGGRLGRRVPRNRRASRWTLGLRRTWKPGVAVLMSSVICQHINSCMQKVFNVYQHHLLARLSTLSATVLMVRES